MTIEAVWFGEELGFEAYDVAGYAAISSSLGDPGTEFDITVAVRQAIQRGFTRIQIRFGFSPATNQDGRADMYVIPTLSSLPTVTIEYTIP